MRVHVSGEAAQSLVEGAKLHGDTPADRLCEAINLLDLLEKQELAGNKIMVHDPIEDTDSHVLISETSKLDETDHIVMWAKELDS